MSRPARSGAGAGESLKRAFSIERVEAHVDTLERVKHGPALRNQLQHREPGLCGDGDLPASLVRVLVPNVKAGYEWMDS